jgi:hypothetical protein
VATGLKMADVQRDLRRKEWKDYALERWQEDADAIDAFEPLIRQALRFIDEESKTRSVDDLYRAVVLLRWLQKLKPSLICEMGSGRSSVLFSVWSARFGASYTAFEQNDAWRRITARAIAMACGSGEVVTCSVISVGSTGLRFDRDIPSEADLVYVDGPYGGGKKYLTPDRKCINFDVPHLWEGGVKPRAILVSARRNTALYLAAMPQAADYEITHQYVREQIAADPHQPRHTSFIRRY